MDITVFSEQVISNIVMTKWTFYLFKKKVLIW